MKSMSGNNYLKLNDNILSKALYRYSNFWKISDINREVGLISDVQ